MPSTRFGSTRRAWLTAFLGTYILLQFGWWAWLLIDLQSQIPEFEGATTPFWTTPTTMVLGEGLVFLLILAWGFGVIWRGIQREQVHAQKERQFLLAVTHELKTPISAVRLAIDTLQKHQVDETTSRQFLAEALAGTQRLEQQVENILQSNRLVFSQHLSLESFDAEEVMNDAIRRHQIGRFQEREIDFEHHGAPEGLMQGDADALTLAWGNLLENALKYSPNDTPVKVTMTWKANHLVCQFDDGGPGIPPSSRKSVLEQFERVGNPRELHTEGTGLGLYLADQIIGMHKGSLEIGASSRGGCLISTTIPLTA